MKVAERGTSCVSVSRCDISSLPSYINIECVVHIILCLFISVLVMERILAWVESSSGQTFCSVTLVVKGSEL